ncbi:MAG: twin-arginine translocation signal domain-containing protein, partial [Raoultibacter sp.]
MELNRRNFLKGAAVSAVGAAAAVTLGACSPAAKGSGSQSAGKSGGDEYLTAETMKRK